MVIITNVTETPRRIRGKLYPNCLHGAYIARAGMSPALTSARLC